MNWSERSVFDILKDGDGDWRFFEKYDNFGNITAQYKIYDYPFKISYPDFEKYNSKKLLLLVEVKGYNGFFNQEENSLAMKYRHFRHYIVVQHKEGVDVRIVFVIKFRKKKYYFWESLDNILNMEYYLDFSENENGEKEKYIFWCSNEFRTDVKNLGKT